MRGPGRPSFAVPDNHPSRRPGAGTRRGRAPGADRPGHAPAAPSSRATGGHDLPSRDSLRGPSRGTACVPPGLPRSGQRPRRETNGDRRRLKLFVGHVFNVPVRVGTLKTCPTKIEDQPMYRRRRRPEREIAFSFDSFLDLVANVVGIIIRLILVAWVGARSYTGLTQSPPRRGRTPPSVSAEPLLSTAREQKTLKQVRRQLAEAQSALLAHLQEQKQQRGRHAAAAHRLAELDEQRRRLSDEAV